MALISQGRNTFTCSTLFLGIAHPRGALLCFGMTLFRDGVILATKTAALQTVYKSYERAGSTSPACQGPMHPGHAVE